MSRPTYTLNLKPVSLNAARRPRTEAAAPGRTSLQRKFAFGYFFERRAGKTFRDLAEEYAPYLAEVYFPWPGLLSAREIKGDPEKQRKSLIDDMRFCRSKGMQLDLLMNATCYGDTAFTVAQQNDFYANLTLMKEAGIMPDIVTTTSPYIATVAKKYSAGIDRRASVNMRLNSTLAMEYVMDSFDSYYICRDVQRDLPTLKTFAEWARKNDRKLCMLANSACLRYCPWQTFHETLLSHDFVHIYDEMKELKLPSTLCTGIMQEKRYEELLRGSWIRPEDLHRYLPYVSVVKLSTREADRPDLILKAYTSGGYDGDLLLLLDPTFAFLVHPMILDNKAFPKEWSEGKIAGACANHCTHCGKCAKVMELAFKHDPRLPDYSQYSVPAPKPIKMPGR